MISVRNLITGIIVGAVVAVLVREIGQFGFSFDRWIFQGPRFGEAVITGALIGAISQLVGQTRGRR